MAHAATALADSVAFALEHRGDEVFALIFGEGHAKTKAPQLADSAESWGADAIVFESGDLAGPAVAAALGLPSVHHSWGAMLPATWFEAVTGRVEAAWDTIGLKPPPLAGIFEGLYVDLAPPRFQSEMPPGERVEMRPVLVDPGAVPAWLRRLKSPLMYVTLGTLFNDPRLLRTLVDALDGVGSAVVTTSRDVDPAALGTVPVNVHLERFLPQSQVLPLAAAAIGHGGSGSTLGALAHGVPMVLLPMGADQFHVAARSASAGAAIIVRPHEANAATVRRALHTVLGDESYRNAARAVQDELAAMPTPADTAPRSSSSSPADDDRDPLWQLSPEQRSTGAAADPLGHIGLRRPTQSALFGLR